MHKQCIDPNCPAPTGNTEIKDFLLASFWPNSSVPWNRVNSNGFNWKCPTSADTHTDRLDDGEIMAFNMDGGVSIIHHEKKSTQA